MASILIKDTTREQREQIVRESLGDEYDVGCGYESTGINYQLYIDGIKELRELNMEAMKLLMLAALVCMSRNYLTRRFRGLRIANLMLKY